MASLACDRRFKGSRGSVVSLERDILPGVSGREPLNLRSRPCPVEFLFEIWLSKRNNVYTIDKHPYGVIPKPGPMGPDSLLGPENRVFQIEINLICMALSQVGPPAGERFTLPPHQRF